jgi:hypothetical protein
MKSATRGWIVCVSLTIGACGTTPSTGTGTSAPATGTTATSVADAAREKAAGALAAAAAVVQPKREVQLASGTVVAVRLTRALSTVRDRAQDTFDATLEEPVVVNDIEALPAGTRFTGHVTTSQESGRLEGKAVLGVTLDSFELNGQRYPVVTSVNTKASEGHKSRNIKAAAGGAGLGALIGGLAGGGKGVAIGAAVGAGAGTGAAAATGKKNIEIPAETLFRFSLKKALTITA